MKKELICDNCKITPVKLYDAFGRKLCYKCKKDRSKNGQFTRGKVEKDYQGAANFVEKKYGVKIPKSLNE